jgi:CubicO group peptidase (beta-lactamase class C family)
MVMNGNRAPAVLWYALGTLVLPTPVVGQHFPDVERLEEIIRARVEEGRATGIVLGLLEADGTRRVVAYGDPGQNARSLGAQSVFEIGSISKVFTGILLAEMAGRGEVSLEAPVQAYEHEGVTIPSRGGREITLLDLATHRSSLPRLPGNMRAADPRNPYADYTVEQLHEFLSGHGLRRDIGSEYEYSNLAVGLLGHILAARAGTEYETLLRERILDPLGMTMSGIALSPDMEVWLAKGHDQAGNPAENWDLPTLAGAGAIRSNMDDMLTFLEANIGDPTSDLERAMRVSHEPRRDVSAVMSVGLNWHIRSVGDHRIVWHNGGTGGYRTFAGFDPERRVGAVVLTNSARDADDIGFHLLNDQLELTPAPTPISERVEVPVPPEILERYTGEYELTPEFVFTVTRDGDALRAQLTGQPVLPVFAESETEFFYRVVDAQITFVVENGETTALILHQGGAHQTARKIR